VVTAAGAVEVVSSAGGAHAGGSTRAADGTATVVGENAVVVGALGTGGSVVPVVAAPTVAAVGLGSATPHAARLSAAASGPQTRHRRARAEPGGAIDGC
jgi:hypothetical protein